MRSIRWVLWVVLYAGCVGNRPDTAVISDHVATVAMGHSFSISRQSGVQSIAVPVPGWVFFVRDSQIVCSEEETQDGNAFPRYIQIANIDYGLNNSISVVGVALTAGGYQRTDEGCRTAPTSAGCAMCMACLGCCLAPPVGTPPPPTPPRPCAF